MASTDVDVVYQRKFKDDFTLEYQQMTAKLRDTVDTDFSTDGSSIYFDFIGKAAVRQRVTVAEPTQHNPPPHSRRLIRPLSFKADAYLGQPEIQKMGRSPKNKWMQAFVAAHHRNTDDKIVAAAFGTSYAADEDLGETPIALPSEQVVAVNASGLTFAKVKTAKNKMDAAEVPLMDRHAVITPTQDNDLMDIAEAVSSDYVSKRILENGSMDGMYWMGFHWRISNRLPLDGSGDRECLFHHKDAVGLWIPIDVKSNIAPDPGHSFDVACVVEMSLNGTRVQDPGVVKVVCAES